MLVLAMGAGRNFSKVQKNSTNFSGGAHMMPVYIFTCNFHVAWVSVMTHRLCFVHRKQESYFRCKCSRFYTNFRAHQPSVIILKFQRGASDPLTPLPVSMVFAHHLLLKSNNRLGFWKCEYFRPHSQVHISRNRKDRCLLKPSFWCLTSHLSSP